MENWKIIKGYEKYEVSSIGRIISNNTYCKRKKGRLLTIGHDKDGYCKVSIINKDKIRTTASVHRLVALAFIKNPFNKSQVNHKDGNKKNNKIINLEWATPKENTYHSRIVLKNQTINPNSKLSFTIAGKIRSEYKPRKISRNKLAKKYNVSKSTIDRVLSNKTWVNETITKNLKLIKPYKTK